MRFSPDFIEKVQEANNLVDIISQYTVLKQAAGGYMGRCPFPDHQEKTPSFSVSESKQVYHCFGCHKKGNIFTFLQQYSGQSFPEAVEYLAQRARIPMPVDQAEEGPQRQIREKKKAIYELNKISLQHFQYHLRRGSQILKDYLQKRGLDEEIVQTFELGYSPESWDSLAKEFEKKKTLGAFEILPLAVEARLVKPRKDEQSYFDIFRDRLMFPIHLPSGEIVGFGGRILQKGEPKYLNSPETPVFTKGKILYGLYQTAKYVRSEDAALIVEGYMDLISLYQKGFRNVVASMGTAVTIDQAQVIGKLTKNVVALFDGDRAGQEAAERSLPLFFQAGLFPKGIILPDQLDPDDFLKQHGAEAFRALLNGAQDLFLLIFERWLENFTGSPSEKVRVCEMARPILRAVSHQALRSLYYAEMAKRLEVPESWVKQAIEVASPGGQRTATSPKNEITSSNPSVSLVETVSQASSGAMKKVSLRGASPVELQLTRLALKSRANFSFVLSENSFSLITHPVLRRVLERAREVYGQDVEKFDKLPSLLINFLEEPEFLFEGGISSGGVSKWSHSKIESPKISELQFAEPGEFEKRSSQDDKQSDLMQFSSRLVSEEIGDAEVQLIKDVIKKLKENDLKTQLRNLKEQLRTSPSEESLQKLQDIQKQINQLKHGV